MTDQQRDDRDRDDEGAIGQATGTDSTMGQGDTGSDMASPQGGSADNDGGTIGDYTSSDADMGGTAGGGSGGESAHEQAPRTG